MHDPKLETHPKKHQSFFSYLGILLTQPELFSSTGISQGLSQSILSCTLDADKVINPTQQAHMNSFLWAHSLNSLFESETNWILITTSY